MVSCDLERSVIIGSSWIGGGQLGRPMTPSPGRRVAVRGSGRAGRCQSACLPALKAVPALRPNLVRLFIVDDPRCWLPA